jgi:UDP-N-acetylglucosamine--N-acetylmuramyl-(pentapeptide) pyrophosphoryl-undecaprenol N-acetylglucosamine transferase
VTTILLAGGGTGGHLMPALALADATGRLHPDWRCVFAGAERGIEATVLPGRGVPYHLLPFHPFYRRQWWKNLRWPVLLPSLLRRVDAMLDAERPAAVIGTGGYVSGPVLWRAAKRNFPTGILELDVRPGVATRLLAGRVREIWLAAPETLAALPDTGRATVTGAPILPPDPDRRSSAMRRFAITIDRPVLVVTGGSQGSLAINRIVAEWLRGGGGRTLQVIWATGRATHTEFASLDNPPNVNVLPFIEPMADAWSVADLCVARAGMMTLAELCAWGIPSVLIPLPSAASDHQTHNARAMAAAGAAVVLPQAGLDAAALAAALHDVLATDSRLASMAAAARARGNPGAAAFIAQRIATLATGGPCVDANS